MKAIMLAAGLGSRISELTNSVPKAIRRYAIVRFLKTRKIISTPIL